MLRIFLLLLLSLALLSPLSRSLAAEQTRIADRNVQMLEEAAGVLLAVAAQIRANRSNFDSSPIKIEVNWPPKVELAPKGPHIDLCYQRCSSDARERE